MKIEKIRENPQHLGVLVSKINEIIDLLVIKKESCKICTDFVPGGIIKTTIDNKCIECERGVGTAQELFGISELELEYDKGFYAGFVAGVRKADEWEKNKQEKPTK